MNDLVKVENGKIVVAQEFTQKYVEFQKKALEMKLIEKEVREELKKAMEENGILGFEDDFIKVIYKKASSKTIIDSTRLKEERPDIAKEYSKTSNVSSSVSIEVKC